MLVAILVMTIVNFICIILIYPVIAYVTDRNTDGKLRERDEKSVNLESRMFMDEGRIDRLERSIRTPRPREAGNENVVEGMAGIRRG